MSGFNLDDYVTVAERIEQFYGQFPEGSLQAEIFELSDKQIVVRAYAYRQPDDPRPSIAHSSLSIPGTTPYTRGSEIENAETSAVGRAIALLGFGVKKSVGSRDELRAKGAESKPHDGSLIGIARVGTKQTSDGQLREAIPEGETEPTHILGFRLESAEGDKGGILVEARGDMAFQLALVRDSWFNQRVTCFGRLSTRSFPKGKTTVKYEVLQLERIVAPTFELPSGDALPSPPVPDDAGVPDSGGASSTAASATPLEVKAAAPTESDEGASDVPAQTPEAAEGEDEPADGTPAAAEAGARASAVCGNKGSMDTICTLPKGHEGRHEERATDGRVLARW